MDFLSYLPGFWIWGLFFIIYLAIKLHYSKRFYQLAAKLPGPSTWPIVGNAYRDFQPYSTSILYDLCRLCSEYGGFVRVWFGGDLAVCISRIEDLEVFFSHPKLLDKGKNYFVYATGLGKGLFTANGEDYRRVKKHYISTYSTTVLKEYLPIFVRRGKTLLTNLSKLDGKPESNVHPLIFDYAFLSICDIALEYDLDGKEERYKQIGIQIEFMAHKAYERILNPFEHPDIIYPFTPNGKKYKKVNTYARESVGHVIEFKRRELKELKINNPAEYETKKELFIYKILNDPTISDKELIDHVATIIATGSDTTASTISFSLMMLGSHPEVQQKVYEEAMAIHEKLAGRPITADDLEDYKYIEMVLKETMRLFPVGPIIARRTSEDIQFSKYLVPKGTDVLFLQVHTNRDPVRYPDPLKFDPDRFLFESTEDKHRFDFTPFSAGPRTCIGAKYAMMSMKTTIASIIKNFKVYSNKKVSDITLSAETTLKPAEGCVIRLEKRREELI